ncbi:class I SAM-dependent methyltransferase [Streptomyces asiaticus]|uniref:class I SAM-dependent methyltransferase n=1 Tax=Streptomyces asiaticus TaxID=114695 RepID=UPI003D725F0E
MAPLDAIARTSLLTAALRAEETRRPDRLYEDPLAARLVGALGGDLLGQVADASGPRDTDPGQGDPGRHVSGRKVPSTVDFNAIRTRYFDDYLLTQVRDGGCSQVVMVAAGMDTRAHRLPWPRAIELFELDRPGVLEAKGSALGDEPVHRRVTRRPIGVDLLGPDWMDALVMAGYRPEEPSLWLLEGLLYYLTDDETRRLLSRVADLTAPGSRIAADMVSATTLTAPAVAPLLEVFERQGCPWLSGHDEPEALFAEYGIEAEAVQPGEGSAHYGRWPDPVHPRHVPDVERVFLVHGVRK